LVNTEIASLYSLNSSKKFMHGARLRRLKALSVLLGSTLIEKSIYRKALNILRFHPESYLPSAPSEINGFALLFSLSRTEDSAIALAKEELDQVYRAVTGRTRARQKAVPRDPLERSAHLRRLGTVKTFLSLRRAALRSLLGEEIALPDNPSPHAKGYLILALDRGEYQQLRRHNEETVDRRRENQAHVHDTLAYLQHAIELTRSDDAMRVLAGLLALTGRRPIESKSPAKE
jgi:hypothetical protein